MNFFSKFIFFRLFFSFFEVNLFAKELTVKEYLIQVYEVNFDIKRSILDTQSTTLDYEIGNLSMYTPQVLYNLELEHSKKNTLGISNLKDSSWGFRQSLGIEQPIGISGTKLGLSYAHIHKPSFNFMETLTGTSLTGSQDLSSDNKDFSQIKFSLGQSLGRSGPFFSEIKNKNNLLKVKKQLTESHQKGVVQNTLIKSWITALQYISKKNEEEMVDEELLVAEKIYQFKKEQFAKKSIRKTDLYIAESFFIQKEMGKKKILDELQNLLDNLQKLANLQGEFIFLDSGESMKLDLEKLQSKFNTLERPDLSVQMHLQDMQVLQNKIAFSESLPKVDIAANIILHSGVNRKNWVESVSHTFSEVPEFAFFVSISTPLIPKVMKKNLLENRIKLTKQKESLLELQNQSIRDVAVSQKRWQLAKLLTNDSEKILQNSRNILLENRKNFQNGKIDLDDYFRSEEKYEQSFGLRNKCKLQEQMLFISFLVSQGVQISSLLYET